MTPTLNPSGFSSSIILPRTSSHQPPQGCLFFFGQIEQAGDVPVGNDEHVALCDRKCVEKSCCKIVLQQDARFLQVTKWALGLIHVRIITKLNPRVQVAGLPFVVPINSDGEGL